MFFLVNAIIGTALLVIGKLTKMPTIGIGVFGHPILFQLYALAVSLQRPGTPVP